MTLAPRLISFSCRLVSDHGSAVFGIASVARNCLGRHLSYVLRNLRVRSLIVAGIMTDQCVESAVRDACDLLSRTPAPPTAPTATNNR
jgi:nicotinamidase-related amidase